VLSRYSVRWLAKLLSNACASLQSSPMAPRTSWSLRLMADVLFFKKSRTSFALKSRTGTWSTTGPLVCPAGAGPAALPFPPQALPGAAGAACGRPPSLVGVFAPELRSWVGRFPCRQLFALSAEIQTCAIRESKTHRFSPAPLIVEIVRTGRERSGVQWWRYKPLELSNRGRRGKLQSVLQPMEMLKYK
jgi:hypothetical protein